MGWLVGQGVRSLGSVLGQGVCPLGSILGQGVRSLGSVLSQGVCPLARLVGQGVRSLGSVLGQGSVLGSVLDQGVCPLGSVLGQGVCPFGSLTRGNGMNEQGHINFQNAIIIEKAKRMLTMKSLKMKAFTWIESLNDQYSINSFTGNHAAYFKLDGFADEPEVYIRFTDAGLDFGYEAVQWN
ncbi:hypothetical protein B9K06_14460 [Bacillus sp. OG2]|nr:hypothetical protein B9K06_14460 [Bacillus sp. OG2]